MQFTHSIVLNTLQRVQSFMDANAGVLGALNRSAYRRILDAVVATLSSHAVKQAASKRLGVAETAKQRVLRNALKLNHMRPIATVAASQLQQAPEFLALKMPAANTTSRRLIAAAGAMEQAASGYIPTFLDAGLPADFLAQLRESSAALNTSVANRGATTSSQTGATAGLKAEAARGRDAVRVLDSLIEPLLAGDPVLLVQWKTAKRFGGKGTVVSTTSIDAAAKGVVTPSASLTRSESLEPVVAGASGETTAASSAPPFTAPAAE